MTSTLIPEPTGSYVPFLFVEEHATRTRKGAVEFLVATAAGLRWHS